ncbi:MAG TPA: glutamine synthetase [Ruminococcus sp.]|nr:glutamine synthetase [Ruminococcus sp.]
MEFTPKELLNFVTENDVKFIRLTFCDMQGNMKNIAIMPDELPRAFSHGILLDAAGFSDCYQDLLLVPDSSTLSVLPWRPKSGRVVRFFCSIMNLDGTHYAGEIRYALQSYIKELHKQGYSCEFGTKSEFYLFDCDQEGKPTRVPHDNAGYLDVAPLDKCENTRREICLSLEEMGLNPTRSAHKYGPAQNEIDFRCAEPVTAADNMVHYKTVVKTIAAQNGLYASFMPMPLKGNYGSALTIIMSIKKDGKNIFELEDGKISEIGQSFIAGVLEHMPELTVFLNPIINSYRRLNHAKAPNHINWSFDNRNPLLRVPAQVGVHPRIEIRSADCCCNPYISFRLLLCAGMDGIKNNLVLSDALELTAERKNFAELPENLDSAYMTARGSKFIEENLPPEIYRNFFGNVEHLLSQYVHAEDREAFEYEYFLSE